MSDRVTYSNLALGASGCSVRIASPDDNSKEAAEIRAAWDEARKATLRAGKWNCAMKRFKLPALASSAALTDEIYPFERAFQMPTGALRLVDLVDARESDKWKLERGRILTDLDAPLRVSCVIDIEDCTQWDESFGAAFVQRLAWHICDNLTGDRARKSDCWAAFAALTGEAKGVDAVENPPEDHAESGWILARSSC